MFGFIKDDFLRRCFSFHPLFIGGNPFDSSSIYAIVDYLEREWGVHHPMGGMGAIVSGMARLFGEPGGVLELNAEVAEILVEERRTVGVRMADGRVRRAATVVSNADVAYTYSPRTSRSTSTGRPTSTRVWPPAGCEALYMRSPVPNLSSGTDWSQIARDYRDRLIGFLERNYMPGLSRHIVYEHMVDPRYDRDTLNNSLGAAFNMQPLLTQSAWFRPHNQSKEFGNLYFVGGGTHPGAGLPGALSSAVIADRLIGAP